MIESGVPKEKLGLMNAPFQIVQILTPILIGNIANSNRPLDLFVKIYPIRLVFELFISILLQIGTKLPINEPELVSTVKRLDQCHFIVFQFGLNSRNVFLFTFCLF